MDRFLAGLSYSTGLLIGFASVEVDHGGRLSAMGGVRPLVIVKGDPLPNAELKRLLADAMLDNVALKDLLSKNV